MAPIPRTSRLLLQDKRQIDPMARWNWDSPSNTERASRTLRVVIAGNVIVAVLEGQDIYSTVRFYQVGVKIDPTDIPFLIVRDRGAPPPPLRLVIAPHLQDSLGHLHTRIGRRKREPAPIQMSYPTPRFRVAILIPQTNGPALTIAGQDIPTGNVPVFPPDRYSRPPGAIGGIGIQLIPPPRGWWRGHMNKRGIAS